LLKERDINSYRLIRSLELVEAGITDDEEINKIMEKEFDEKSVEEIRDYECEFPNEDNPRIKTKSWN
jgi:hypothetical protein